MKETYTIISNKVEHDIEAINMREAADKFLDSAKFDDPEMFAVRSPNAGPGIRPTKFFTEDLERSRRRKKNEKRTESNSEAEKKITENTNKITHIIDHINNRNDDLFEKIIESNTKAMGKAAADWTIQVIEHIKAESKQNAINLNDSTNLKEDNNRLKTENEKHIEALKKADEKYDLLKTDIDNKNNQDAEDVKQDETQNTNLAAKIWPESLSTKNDRGHFVRLTKCFINGDITEREWQLLLMVPYQIIDEEFKVNIPVLHTYTEHLFTVLNHLMHKEVLPKESCEAIVESFAEWLSETTKKYTLEAPTIGGGFKGSIHNKREGSGKVITKVHSMVIYKKGENRPNQMAEVDV